MVDGPTRLQRVSQSAQKALERFARHRRIFSWLILASGPALVFFCTFRFLLGHFYNGGYLLDGGHYAELIWRNIDLSSLHSPTRQSYYTIHITPLFSLLSGLSYVVPWNRIGYFSAFVASISVLGSGIVVRVLHKPESTLLDDLLSTGLGVLFGLNGLMLGPVLYPHYEHIMPLCAAAFAYCLLGARAPRWRWVLLALALLTREDGGVHAFFLFAVLIGAKRVGVAISVSYRALFVPLLAAAAMSATMIAVQKLSPLNTFSAFDNSFANNPVTALFSMSGGTFAQRLRFLLAERAFVWTPFAASVFCALLFRDAGYVIGHASNIPWFFLLFTADYDATSTFSLYYHFPFLIGCLWPILWATLQGAGRTTIYCLSLAVNLGALQPTAFKPIWDAEITFERIAATERFMELLRPTLATANNGVLADSAMTALMPDLITPEQILSENTEAPNARALIFSGCYPLDREKVFNFLKRNEWKAIARINGTQYFVGVHSPSAVKGWGLPLKWLTLTTYPQTVRCQRQ